MRSANPAAYLLYRRPREQGGAIAGPKVLEHMWTACSILKATERRANRIVARRKERYVSRTRSRFR
jgi:predicted ATP-dependent serine protease